MDLPKINGNGKSLQNSLNMSVTDNHEKYTLLCVLRPIFNGVVECEMKSTKNLIGTTYIVPFGGAFVIHSWWGIGLKR